MPATPPLGSAARWPLGLAALAAVLLALGAAACTNRTVGGPAAAGTVSGRVVDSAARPVAGASVRFHRNANAVLSDADGHFVLAFSYDAHLAPHRTVAVIEKPPHEPLSVEVLLSDGAAIDLGDLTLE